MPKNINKTKKRKKFRSDNRFLNLKFVFLNLLAKFKSRNKAQTKSDPVRQDIIKLDIIFFNKKKSILMTFKI